MRRLLDILGVVCAVLMLGQEVVSVEMKTKDKDKVEIVLQTGHTDSVISTAFSPDGKYIVSGSEDESLMLWDTNTGNLLLTMVSFKDGEWVVYTPENYYNSSPKGDKYVAFRLGNEVYSSEQYAAIYKRPEIIAKVLKGEDIKEIKRQ